MLGIVMMIWGMILLILSAVDYVGRLLGLWTIEMMPTSFSTTGIGLVLVGMLLSKKDKKLQ